MTLFFIVILVCAILLCLLGALPIWAGVAVALSCLLAMAVQTYFRKQAVDLQNRRAKNLSAKWGTRVRYLGGLPVPPGSTGSLYLLQDELLFETDQDHLAVKLSDVAKIVPARADQIRKMPDRKLGAFLEAGTSRAFSALRDMIRRRDSLLRQTVILFIVIRHDKEEPELIVLSSVERARKLEEMLLNPSLKGKTSARFLLGRSE